MSVSSTINKILCEHFEEDPGRTQAYQASRALGDEERRLYSEVYDEVQRWRLRNAMNAKDAELRSHTLTIVRYLLRWPAGVLRDQALALYLIPLRANEELESLVVGAPILAMDAARGSDFYGVKPDLSASERKSVDELEQEYLAFHARKARENVKRPS